MSSIIDLFNPSFLMFLGILVLSISLLVIYYESKVRDQNHKISSMISLVSTLADDMNGVKIGLNHLAISQFGGNRPNSLDQFSLNKTNSELIDVSDDEHEEIDLEEEEEEENDMEELDEEEEEDNNEEGEDFYNDDFGDEDDEEDIQDEIKVLKLNLNDNNKNNFDLEDINVTDINEFDELNNNLENKIEQDNFKTINVNLEEILDLKKLSLNKLRNIVLEKGIIKDASKFNKNKLLKLLGVE